MKLWLDDLRPAPEGWTRAKTVGEAIRLLESGDVTEASLDHDVNWDPGGTDEDWENRRTGMAVVLWMERTGIWPINGVAVHSANVTGGRERMLEVIQRNVHKCP